MTNLQSVNGTTGKETIYVDVDDEITAIIDKVGAAKGKIVALVLPKRCPVLQSVVNMKLLKRTADNAGKNLVLVTTESGLLPLAGNVGLYVASSPSSKPVIPEGPSASDDTEDIDKPLRVVDGNAPESEEDFDAKASASKSIGELAANTGGEDGDDVDESIDMSNAADTAAVLSNAAKKSSKTTKPKKDKRLKVPNFDRFRKTIVFGVLLLILLIVAGYFAFVVLPKATITIGTDSSTIPTNLSLTLDTTATSLDSTNDIVPATAQSQQKTTSQTVPATGQQNNGTKATGQVTMAAQECAPNLGQPANVPIGTSVSTGGVTFITQETTQFSALGSGHGSCQTYQAAAATNITALNAGANGNVSSATFSVSGRSDISGTGSTSSGTDNIVTVVQQSDIDNATSKINAGSSDSVKQELESNLEAKGLMPVPATFLAGTPQVTNSVQAGTPASNVTVTSATTYTMLGVSKSNLQTLVLANVNGQLDKGKQVVLDDGVANAQFSENTSGTATNATVNMSTTSLAGPQLNAASLKTQLAGMKSGDVQSYIKQTPGVTSVTVKFSPFWVSSVPKKATKVTISIEKASS